MLRLIKERICLVSKVSANLLWIGWKVVWRAADVVTIGQPGHSKVQRQVAQVMKHGMAYAAS